MHCDCRDRLEVALRAIGGREHGIVLYLRQEGAVSGC
jgi:GTP cyclohydrolase II